MKTTDCVIRYARKYLGHGAMESSARLCLEDAINLANNGDYDNARNRAIKSLAYSIGVFHPVYRECTE
jgi:uncharacterized protein (UPF0332 family)